MNKTIVIGRVGNDAIGKEVNGKTVHNFSIASSKKVNNVEVTTWFDCALWDKPNVVNFVKKGGLVYVEGEVKAEAYMKDNMPTSRLKITVFNIQFLGGSNNNVPLDAPKTHPASAPHNAKVTAPELDSSLPF